MKRFRAKPMPSTKTKYRSMMSQSIRVRFTLFCYVPSIGHKTPKAKCTQMSDFRLEETAYILKLLKIIPATKHQERRLVKTPPPDKLVRMIPTLEWTNEGVRFLDQTRLPLEETYVLA